MNIILLSGGSGKRLWPLSNDVRSKQFIKLFKRPDGTYESMLQRVYRQIKTVTPDAAVTIATPQAQVPAIINHLGSDVRISVEPCRRDTFPAIALAAAYLHDVMGVPEEQTAVVCPVDPYVDDSYFDALRQMAQIADRGEANLVLMGIEPTYPSEKYGYIIPQDKAPVSLVDKFKEKPDAQTAREYIAQGALWNGGVFAFRLRYVLEQARARLNYTTYQDLFDRYASLTKISFDYEVVEKEPRIQVVRYGGAWKDVGTWNTLADAMSENTWGSVVLDGQCQQVHALNELNIPLLVMNMKNAIIAASPQGILVAEREASARIKQFADAIDQEARFFEEAWGNYVVLDVGDQSMTVRLDIKAGYAMNAHSHAYRDETWTVVKGTGRATVDGQNIPLQPGASLRLPQGSRHSLFAETPMTVIVVQVGEEIASEDKITYTE